MFIFNFLCAKC